MKRINYKFRDSSTSFYFDGNFPYLKKLVEQKHAVIITDENVYGKFQKRFAGWNTIVLKAGEEFKTQPTVDAIIDQLIEFGTDRRTTLVGVGGGVITDITGYAASVYMRGIPFGFLPTSLLAMVDACIGGKNGIDVGVYKNMVGTIRQPSFIFYDMSFLSTLPHQEWVNGFAEIIKHACIKDAPLFRGLETGSVERFKKSRKAISDLVKRNATIKIRVVQNDEFEKGDRRLLNFGHTLGHALETQYHLTHGQAVAIGMVYASKISAEITGFKNADRVAKLIERYELPTTAEFDRQRVIDVMKMDKKREKSEMNYVLLDRIGKGLVRGIPVAKLENMIRRLA